MIYLVLLRIGGIGKKLKLKEGPNETHFFHLFRKTKDKCEVSPVVGDKLAHTAQTVDHVTGEATVNGNATLDSKDFEMRSEVMLIITAFHMSYIIHAEESLSFQHKQIVAHRIEYHQQNLPNKLC